MFRWSVLAVLLFAVGLSAAPILKDGDRIVIYGDSITEQRLYSRYLQQYLYCRYPELKLTVFNAGWSGDRAPGALNRLERDVLWLKPTVVTLFFGMNDGGYKKLDEPTVQTFAKGIEGIITKLQEKGVRVVVFTPGCVDYNKQKRLGDCDYNATLDALGKAALDLAAKYKCANADVIHPMLAYQAAQKANNAAYSMIPDAVHPDSNGHLVMANAMLKAFNVDPLPTLGTFDAAANTGDGIKAVTNTAEKLVLELTLPNVPFWYDASTAGTVKACGLSALVAQALTIKGLKEAAYDLYVDGTRIGKVPAEVLAAGYVLPGTVSLRGRMLHEMIMRKENNYFSAWREYRLPLGEAAGAKEIVDGLMNIDTQYTAIIQAISQQKDKVTLTLVPRPLTANLAEGCKYVCSDPNTHNWGIGGLTDGSWEADAGHCFATNEADAFPKTATIDLEKAAMVGSVIVGTPQFGSTKTITVSVSADGKTFTEVGTHTFELKKAERFTFKFEPVNARYVRLTYLDHYPDNNGYPNTFIFTTEAEVYPAK
jgi:lysophospholipase L1-like esterase